MLSRGIVIVRGMKRRALLFASIFTNDRAADAPAAVLSM